MILYLLLIQIAGMLHKLWFSIYHLHQNYVSSEPSFTKPDAFDWANELSAHTEGIKKELDAYLSKKSLSSYFNSSMVSKQNSWKTIALKTWSVELYKNQTDFPYTLSLINKYPQIISASFNMLQANSKILPHSGDTNAIYRCHLGLDIPAGLPDCGFRVQSESRAWENGKWLIFTDAFDHEAWNNSQKDRFILLIDVLRDDYMSKKGFITSTVLTSLFLQKRAEKLKFIYKIKNRFVIYAIVSMLRPFAFLSIKMANVFKLY